MHYSFKTLSWLIPTHSLLEKKGEREKGKRSQEKGRMERNGRERSERRLC